MNIITVYLSSTEGFVTVGGHEILDAPLKAKATLGYLPEQPPLYLDMTVKEYLHFVFTLKKIKLLKKRHIEEICGLVKIDDVMGRKIQNLSKGYRQRVGLAQALLGNPEALILDEPTVGLDPKQIIEIRELIRSLGKRHTIILSSHILSEVQAVCGRVIVIHNGKIVADDTPGNLSDGLSGSAELLVRVAGPPKGVRALLESLPGVAGVEQRQPGEKSARDFALTLKKGSDVRKELFFALSEKRWPLLGLRSAETSLEDVFLRLTRPEEE
jgi:ABC-2 type transport system ATP-binding protein